FEHPNKPAAAASTKPHGTKIVLPAAPPPAPPAAGAPARDRKGKGAIYRVDADGRVEQMHALPDSYFTALHADKDGSIWAAAGASASGALTPEPRAGNTARPDKTWSDWAAPKSSSARGDGRVVSPAGRYLQFRAGFGKDARLRDVAIYYQPQNQRARVVEVTA